MHFAIGKQISDIRRHARPAETKDPCDLQSIKKTVVQFRETGRRSHFILYKNYGQRLIRFSKDRFFLRIMSDVRREVLLKLRKTFCVLIPPTTHIRITWSLPFRWQSGHMRKTFLSHFSKPVMRMKTHWLFFVVYITTCWSTEDQLFHVWWLFCVLQGIF